MNFLSNYYPSAVNNAALNTMRGGPLATHADVQTPPVPVGIYSAYAQHGESVTLHLREQANSLHTDDFAITDTSTNRVVFQVKGHSRASLASLTEKKEMYDARGAHLYTLRRRGLSLFHETYEGVEPRSGRVVFVVESNMGRGKTLTVSFLNTANRGENATFHLGQDMVSVGAVQTECRSTGNSHWSI